jgi:uncharacterized protein YraI
MRLPALIAAAALLLYAGPAAAQAENAMTTGHVNMRAGPAVTNPVIVTVPGGSPVHVRGCIHDFTWCDTQYGPHRGWVSAAYLTSTHAGYRGRRFQDVGPQLGIGIVAGTILRELFHDRDMPRRRAACNENRARWAVGERARDRVVEQARVDARARTVRVVRPGMFYTQDYQPTRLNIEVNRRNRIVDLRCG